MIAKSFRAIVSKAPISETQMRVSVIIQVRFRPGSCPNIGAKLWAPVASLEIRTQ